MRLSHYCIIFVALLFLSHQSPLYAERLLREQYPLRSLHLNWSPFVSDLAKRESFLTEIGINWSSTNAIKSNYRVDAEVLELSPSIQYGITDSLELHATLPVLWRGSGALDNTIDAWHVLFGLPRGNRDRVPDNEFVIEGDTDSGGRFLINEQGFGLSNLQVGIRYQLLEEREIAPEIIFETLTSLPTATNQYGHDSIDGGLGISLRKGMGSLSTQIGAMAFIYGDREIEGIRYRRTHFEGHFHLDYQVSESFKPFVGLIGSTEVITNISGHPSGYVYLDIGANIKPSKRVFFDLSIREELASGRGSVDFSLQSSIGISFS